MKFSTQKNVLQMQMETVNFVSVICIWLIKDVVRKWLTTTLILKNALLLITTQVLLQPLLMTIYVSKSTKAIVKNATLVTLWVLATVVQALIFLTKVAKLLMLTAEFNCVNNKKFTTEKLFVNKSLLVMIGDCYLVNSQIILTSITGPTNIVVL